MTIKIVHQWGFDHNGMHDADKWARILAVGQKCGTLGFSGEWMTPDELDKMRDEHPGPLTLQLKPYMTRPRLPFVESLQQNDLHKTCDRVRAHIPPERISKIFLDTEVFTPETDEEIATVRRLYLEAYNIVRVEFPGIPIVWYADLDAPEHRLDLAPMDGHS